MEGNKDAAMQCFKVAQKALSLGQNEKALKFLKKSIQLYPSSQAQELLKSLSAKNSNSHGNKHSRNNGASRSYGTFPSQSTNGATGAQEEDTESVNSYTTEQHSAVKRVNKSKDYYEILGVNKDATDSDLKKAYRKLALQLHPDKNKAPGATEAFKAVGKAFGVLSDSEKRHNYDLYGPEEATRLRSRRQYSNFDDGYQDIDPDEIFNMFFGGGFPSGNVRVFRRGNTFYSYGNRSNERGGQNHGHGNQQVAAWIQFMPLLVLLLLTLFSNLVVYDNPYSLHAHGDYVYRRETVNLKVNYYVKHTFDKDYKGTDLRRLERRVEDDYVEYMRGTCYQERVTKENLRRKGVYFSNKDFIKQAENMKTPSCDRLEEVFRRGG